MEASRRSFLTGLAAAFAAPAIVRIDNIMPVKTVLWTPEPPVFMIGINSWATYRWVAAPENAFVSPEGKVREIIFEAINPWPERPIEAKVYRGNNGNLRIEHSNGTVVAYTMVKEDGTVVEREIYNANPTGLVAVEDLYLKMRKV